MPLLDIGHPPLVALIRDFYSNISIHIYDSSTLVKSWIRGVEYTITPRVVTDALGVPLVQHLVYPYDESLLWTTSCLTSLGLLSGGVLILGSLLLSSLRLPIFSLG